MGRLLSDPLAIDGKAGTARFAMIRRLIKVLPMSSVYFVTYVPGSTNRYGMHPTAIAVG